MSNAEYDEAYAAMVAAVAYAVATREERLVSQEKPADTFASEKKPMAKKLAPERKAISFDEPRPTPQSKSPFKRGESLKRPLEGNKSSKWFSGKEPIDDAYDDGPEANVSVRRPLRPALKKPEGIIPDEKVEDKLLIDSGQSIKKDPNFTRKAPDKKGSKKFEQDQGNQMVPPVAAPVGSGRESGIPTSTTVLASEAQVMADTWEREKLFKIKKQYNETMETIAEWEAEKKAKARRQKELKDESTSERKRAKSLEEYKEEMSRINKVAMASRLAAEEKKRNMERKVRDKAHMIRSTGKLPRTCGCF